MSSDKDLYKLELLSLVSRISQEILNHTSINDKSLAEFVISLHQKSKTKDEFKTKLDEVGAGFEPAFVDTLDRLILSLHPKYKKKSKKALKTATDATDKLPQEKLSAEKELQRRLLPALSKPDTAYAPSFQSDEDAKSRQKVAGAPEVLDKEVGDLMSQLEGVGKKARMSTSQQEDFEPGPSKRARYDDDGGRGRDPTPRDSGYGPRGGGDSGYGQRGGDNGYGPRGGGGGGGGYGGGGRDGAFHARPQLDEKPVLYKIYDGTVSGWKDFGAFVSLEGLRGRFEGMVHVGSIALGQRISNPADVLTRGQPCKVKVMSVSGTRISLSMKDVDQRTGGDLTPHLRQRTEEELRADEERMRAPIPPPSGTSSNATPLYAVDEPKGSSAKRLTSPERWEIKQLIASGVVDAAEYPNLDEEHTLSLGGGNGGAEIDEEVDIETREDEAPFLAGQKRGIMEMSPVKVVKAPDGSLNRAALASEVYAKERRELRQQEAQDKADSEARDFNAPWLDPMAAKGDKQFAMDLRGSLMGEKGMDEPEWKKENKSLTFGIVTNKTIQEQRHALPVYKFRNELVEAVKHNNVLIVIGETGSGKTTQMTQFLAEEGFAERGKIGCTQPRRVAATSVAKRVAEEVGCRLGEEVGYAIRFEDCTGPDTKIKYMTAGLLLREALIDPDVSAYSCIILDEAHERNIDTDILFGLLKRTLKRRPDFKLIVTSATLNAEKFSEYFFGCAIFTVPGNTFPVEILYTKEPESDYLDASLITVMQIHLSEPPGDILLFLTGQEEIDSSCEILYERMKALGSQVPQLSIYPIYGAQISSVQSKVFEPTPEGTRKVVIATNIAETSITIPGIYYVIDPGFTKQNHYDPKLGMDHLQVMPISQAQARQRSGRAGRTGPGKAYRLYTEIAFRNEMLPNPVPEIQRTNLSSTILTLKAMGINDLIAFDFMDPPPAQTLITALENLFALGALDDEGLLTRLGRKMADFPIEPQMAKMLIASVDYGCSEEMLTIVAMLSVQNVFYRPKDKQAQADAKKAKFHQPEGDHLTLLTVYNGWKASKFSAPWCYENFIQARNMKSAQDVRKQLLGMMDRYKHDIISAGNNFDRVRKAICSGYFKNACKKDPTEGYKTLTEGTPVFIHPSSALFNRPPEWCIYNEIVLTTKEYMHVVLAIEPKWLSEVAPAFYKVADTNKISKRKASERIEPLFNKYEKPDEWRISRTKKVTRSSQTFG